MNEALHESVQPSVTTLLRGLPPLHAGAIAHMAADGSIAVASGCRLQVFHPQGNTCRAGHCIAFDEPVTAITESRRGLIVASGSQLHLLDGERRWPLAKLDGSIGSLVASGRRLHAVVTRSERLDARLVEIDLVHNAIASERSLASAQTMLTTDANGEWLGLSDGSTFRMQQVPAARAPCPPDEQPAGHGAPAPAEPVPCPCQHADDPARPAEPSFPAPDRPPRDPCDRGQSGVPTPDGGRVVGDGKGVKKHPPGSLGDPNPCSLHLFFDVATIRQAGNFLIAMDRQARNVAVLAFTDLQPLQQMQFRRGAVVLSHPSREEMVVFEHRSQSWVMHQLNAITLDPLTRLPPIDVHTLDKPIVFVGTPLPVLKGNRAPATGTKRVLVLPVVDPGQNFVDADLPKLAAYFRRTGFPRVKDYYIENSFGSLNDLQYTFYGVELGQGAGPIRLPRPISSYYNPTYVGAHVDLVKKGLSFPAALVFDGRERFTLTAQPLSGGRGSISLQVRFPALLLWLNHKLWPARIHFAGTETATVQVRLPTGTATTLTLKFGAFTLVINSAGELATKLPQLETWLDGVFVAAETAAGLPARLFTRPRIQRIDQGENGPGILATSLFHTQASGPKLEVSSISYSGIEDSLGFKSSPFIGRVVVSAASKDNFKTFVDLVTVLAQEDANSHVDDRRLAPDPVITLDAGAGTLTTSLFIADVDGGPGATMTVSGAVETGVLFDTATSVANTLVTAGRSNTPKDGDEGFDGLVNDVFSAAVDRLAAPGQHLARKDDIVKAFQPFEAAMIGVLHPPTAPAGTAPADLVRAEELWSCGPSSWGDVRAVEGPRTAVFRPLPKDIQWFSNWNLLPFAAPPDYPAFCHELGHALGFGDLYKREAGYRNDVVYMGAWAMMGHHPSLSHHCGYHKWQAGWIPDERVATIARPPDDNVVTTELLLTTVERWNFSASFSDDVRAAFGQPGLRVAQLVELDFGGDADLFGLIEARQHGDLFSRSLPNNPAVLITNCIVWWDPTRYAFNDRYRAPVHLLNDPAALTKAGDSFDLARGKVFPAKGTVVTVLRRQAVAGIEVFHLKIDRKNSREFIDLFFSTSDPYYKNPDLWVDWFGDNGKDGKSSSDKIEDVHIYPPEQPRDQGEKIRVPDSGSELHWMVARLRNIGNVHAEKVKVSFSNCDPPGAGDRGNFKVRDTVPLDQVMPTGLDKPVFVKSRWPVEPGFKGHTCVMVEIVDYKVPLDASGAALATDDVWQANNRAQKNVDQVGPAHESPFDPIEFDFSVNNSAKWPEVVYLEPEGLPYGMTLTITPKRRRVAAGETAIFRCKLELDDKVIDASCRGDHDFRINAWRIDDDSSTPWGGVEYQVRPRKRSRTDVSGYWDAAGHVEINGHVAPGNITGQVRIRLAYTDHPARWVTADLKPGGTFSYSEKSPIVMGKLLVNALFEGNKYYSESQSPQRTITPPPPLH